MTLCPSSVAFKASVTLMFLFVRWSSPAHALLTTFQKRGILSLSSPPFVSTFENSRTTRSSFRLSSFTDTKQANERASNRREFLSVSLLQGTCTILWPFTPQRAQATTASAQTASLLQDLQQSRQKLQLVPDLLQAGEWDQVRTLLKTPPVNVLWNTLGDSKNPLVLLSRLTDDPELLDVKDELSLSLQMCDQLTYDNVFVYFQPGNGKVKVKEPTELALKAMKQLDSAIDIVQRQSSDL